MAHIARGVMAVVATGVSVSYAQTTSNVDPLHDRCWAENAGWLQWRTAGTPPGAQGVRVYSTFLAGYAWCENLGWLGLGDGVPGGAGAVWYSNTAGDFGVNILGNGNLTGFAWGENIGWVNFDTSATLGASGSQARFDRASGRFHGFTWGENVGWIQLGNTTQYIASVCFANCDQSTTVPVLNVVDFSCFLNRYASGDLLANCDGSTTPPVLNVTDFSCFLNRYAAGCS